MSALYPRWLFANLTTALTTRRVLLLNGPRQCGKTTLAKQLGKSQFSYRTLDDLTLKTLAENDPLTFLKHPGKTLIIDEIQRVPTLLPAIKMCVDENTQPGQFLLTGSANIQTLPSVQESLAGRIRKLRLRPLAQGEILSTPATFLNRAFHREFSAPSNSNYQRRNLLELAFRGGFPEAIHLAEPDRAQWHRDYISALLERDLYDIVRIHRHSAMQNLTSILAAWSGKFIDPAAICAGLALSKPTLETYINALEALYLIEKIPPWTRTDYARVGKQSKLFMADCGLMASILHWNLAQVELDSDRAGKLLETFVFNELAAQIDMSDGAYRLYHYRDREQREIDFIIERQQDLALLGIEVKAGSAISQNDFKHLKWFQQNLAKDRNFIGIVLYTGELAGALGPNLWAVPFSTLWG